MVMRCSLCCNGHTSTVVSARSVHLPLKGGGLPSGLTRGSTGPDQVRARLRGREGVAIPTPSLPFSRGGRRLRHAFGNQHFLRLQAALSLPRRPKLSISTPSFCSGSSSG